MVHLLALSAVVRLPIASLHPAATEILAAWTRRVSGRGVKDQPTELRLLWSSTVVPAQAKLFRANHFVVLHPKGDTQVTSL